VEKEFGSDTQVVTSLVKHTVKEVLYIIMEFDEDHNHDKSSQRHAFDYFKAIVNTPPFKDNEDIR